MDVNVVVVPLKVLSHPSALSDVGTSRPGCVVGPGDVGDFVVEKSGPARPRLDELITRIEVRILSSRKSGPARC